MKQTVATYIYIYIYFKKGILEMNKHFKNHIYKIISFVSLNTSKLFIYLYKMYFQVLYILYYIYIYNLIKSNNLFCIIFYFFLKILYILYQNIH